MKRIRLALLPLVVAGLSIGFAACGDDSDDSTTGGDAGGGETSLDLVIGDSVPLSGDLADFGPPGQKAADLAIEEINAAIEEAGVDHTVSIVHEDNCGGTDPQARSRRLASSSTPTTQAASPAHGHQRTRSRSPSRSRSPTTSC